MPSTGYLVGSVAICSAVTWALRALPFLALARLRHSALLPYFARYMPIGVMISLVVFALRDAPVAHPRQVAPLAAAAAVTVALHLWRRNLLLSMFVGTAVNVILASLVFR